MSLTLRRFAPVALVLVGTTVGLLLVESTLRVAGLWAMPDYAATNWYRQSSLPGVPYLLKPNLGVTWGGGRIATDEFGLRNEHPAAKPQRVYRILTLGDSVTFGFGVDQKRSFPAVLQDLLNTKGGQQYQVINAGIPGYNIADEGALLPALLARYKPNLVLWTLVSNDYDDSLGVDPEGRITQSNIDHVIEAGFVANWGHNGKPYIDVEDFRRSMLPRVRAELEGRPQPISTAGSLDAWLSSHLYAWSFSRAKATALPAFPGTLKPTEAEILGRYTTADGHHLLMQFFSPVYSSRHVIDQANQALAKAVELCRQAQVPIVLINDGLPVDERWMMARQPAFSYQDLADYLGESAVDFFFANNLGWDGHPSVSGNRKIARALARMLVCRGYVPGGGDCAGADAVATGTRNYWRAFQQRREEFVAQQYGAIDLDRFQGIHQIAGGIFPSRVLPGPMARRAHVLISPGSGKSLLVTVSLASQERITLRLTAFAQYGSVVRDFAISPGQVTIGLDVTSITRAPANPRVPIELQLECVSDKCPPLRLHRIRAE